MGQFDRLGYCVLCAAIVGPATLSASSQACEPAWVQEGELPGLTNPENADRDIGRAWAVFDDGTGPDLYSGGLFTHASELLINGLARWDGNAWSDVGGGVTGVDGVYALVVHNDGAGDALYVAGSFTHAGGVPANNVAKWDGTQWAPGASGTGTRGYRCSWPDGGSLWGCHASTDRARHANVDRRTIACLAEDREAWHPRQVA